MTPAEQMCCAACVFWRPYGDSETGICASVESNEYSAAYLLVEEEGTAALCTNHDFFCKDFTRREGA